MKMEKRNLTCIGCPMGCALLVEMDGKAKVVVRLDLLGCAGVDMPVGFVEKMK